MKQAKSFDAGMQIRRIDIRLKFLFACLTGLGGLVLSAGASHTSIPAVAIFFAVFGFVFVDWLELFSLPPIAAYAAMAVAALFCVSDFMDINAPGNHQMLAVSQLLVFVQAILMLQQKTLRIFEQLGVFCLLELIVAAVFNDAITYGLLLIPIGVVGASALCLLSTSSATSGLLSTDGALSAGEPETGAAVTVQSPTVNRSTISVSAPESWASMSQWALRLPRIALFTLAPAIALVALVFFYGLPRTAQATRLQNRGSALVGFSDELRLEQIGRMMQSTQPALRLYLTDRATGEPYSAVGGVYLRGKVLERYRARFSSDRNTAVWNATPPGTVSETRRLPIEHLPERRSDQNFYDTVDVTVICESMRSNTLFAIAPYHQSRTSSELKHTPELWTVSRRGKTDWVFPRIEYHFGTHAFRSGIQSPLITYRGEGATEPGKLQVDRLGDRYRRLREVAEQRRQQRYRNELLEFDRDAMPTAAELASTFVRDSNGRRRRDYAIAKAMERHFLTSNRYQYTLNLNAESIPGLDPIEQFLRVDRRGHCQYFASALAMMLRSQDIPARLVVGYQTDEYNTLGNHYVARQLHAHAWVEALVDRDQLGAGQVVYGQEPSARYWLRLDPTPPAGRIRESSPGVGQVLDMARNIWDDYVVDMDAERQKKALVGGGSAPMNRSYQRFVDRLSLAVSRIRAGELGGGALALRNIFSWQAAVLAGLVALALGLLVRVRPPAWIRRRLRKADAVGVAEPSLAFYAEALRQLERTGLVRKASQTPGELAEAAEVRFRDLKSDSACESFHFLTSAFYRHRYGPASGSDDLETISSIGDAHRLSVASHPSRVVEALADLTREIDSIVNQQNEAEQAT